MIDFRYHLVSIIAVFFALAVGIVLGAGPLGERVDADLPEQLADMRDQNHQLQEQIRGLEAVQEYRDGFVEAVTPELVDSRLAGRDVLVVALPAADGDQVSQVGEMLSQGGASVTATVDIDESWTDAESETALDALASGLVSSGVTLPEEGNGYDRGAALLAQAFVRPRADEALDGGSPGVLDEATIAASQQVNEEIVVGLTEAELIAVEGDAERKADLAVVVAGPLITDDSALPVEPLVTVVREFDEAGAGAVVAGPPLEQEGELLAAIRGDEELTEQISTVDSADLIVGRIAVVFAALEQENGGSGQYGYAESSNGPMPPIPERLAPEPGTDGDTAAEAPPEDDATDGEDGEG